MADTRVPTEISLSIKESYIGSAYSPQVDINETESGHEIEITYKAPEGLATKSFEVPDKDWQEDETARTQAESARVQAESARVQTESARVQAETARAQAESARVQAESARVTEWQTMSHDIQEATADATHAADETNAFLQDAMGNEAQRVSAEQARIASEAARESAERRRRADETARADAESEREINESGRIAAERARANAETARAQAETTRAASWDTLSSNVTSATQSANQAASEARSAASTATQATTDTRQATSAADTAAANARQATANANQATSNANQATQAATQATAQANQATSNANQAAQSATTATTNANTATESASAAASAANAAAITASQGAESASAATDAAIAATQGAQAATQAAATATTAANQAASDANDAAGRAEDAASNANAAASQADAATTAANAATTVATAATTQATQATQAATTAAEAADEAASDATEAAGMARRASAATWLSGNVPICSIAEGELLTASDVYAAPPRDVDVYGKSEQVQTTGKNLFDPSHILNATGWSVNNGVYTGSIARLYDLYRQTNPYPVQGLSDTAQQYAISLDYKPTNTSGNVAVRFTYADETYDTSGGVMNAAGHYSFTSNASKVVSGVFFTYGASQDVSLSNIQLELGSTATSYEPYTGGAPSPSPNYMQEIESVGSGNIWGGERMADDAVAAVDDQNLCSKGEDAYGRYFTLKANNQINQLPLSTGVQFKENTRYTIILRVSHNNTSLHTNMVVKYTDGTSQHVTTSSYGSEPFVINYVTDANKSVLNIAGGYYSGINCFYYDSCGIFEGNIATSEFVPYDCIALNVCGKNHIDTSFDCSHTIRGVTISQHDGEVTIDGTFSSGVNAVAVAYGSDSFNNANYINALAINGRYAFLLPPGQYSLSYDSNVTTGTMACNVLYGEIGGTVSNGKASIISHRSNSSNPTTIADWTYAMLVVRVTDSGSATVHGTIKNIQLELGTTATDYEPYVGSTVPIPLQGHKLRSLPDGTRDELRLTYQGPSETEGMGTFGVELVQRVDEVTIDRFEAMTGRADISANDFRSAALAPSAIYKTTSSGHADRMLCDSFVPYADLTTVPTTAGHNNQCSYQSGYRLAWFRLEATEFPDLSTANAWLAENPITVFLEFNDEQTHDLGTVDIPVLPAPDLTVWADGGSVQPTIGMGYEQDINIVIANLEAAIADLVTS